MRSYVKVLVLKGRKIGMEYNSVWSITINKKLFDSLIEMCFGRLGLTL